MPQPGALAGGQSTLIFDTKAQEPRLFIDAGGELQGFRWDGTMWRLMTLGGDHQPSPSSLIAYDIGRTRAVAFASATYELVDDAWSFQSSANVPSTSGALGYDDGSDRLVYFGGALGFAQYADATWTWAGSGWQQLTTSGTPPARMLNALAYDQRRGRIVMFGGLGSVDGRQLHLTDTWELSGNTWTQAPAEGPATLRDTPSMAYDQARQRVVLWAAQDEDDAKLWEYDGATWTGTDAPPNLGTAGVLGYDAASQRLLLHDADGRTWARGSSTTAPGTPGSGPDGGVPNGAGAGGADGDGAGTGGEADADGGDGAHHGDGSSCAAIPGVASSAGAWTWLALVAAAYRRRRAQRGAIDACA